MYRIWNDIDEEHFDIYVAQGDTSEETLSRFIRIHLKGPKCRFDAAV